MRKLFWSIFILFLIVPDSIQPERGTRARTMRNHTQRSSHSSSGSHSSSYRPSSSSSSGSSRPSTTTYRATIPVAPTYETTFPPELAAPKDEPTAKSAPPADACADCLSEKPAAAPAAKPESQVFTQDLLLNSLSVNSRVAVTSWNFHFSPAIQYESKFVPTYELDVNFLGLQFSYLTTFPLQSSNLFREIPIIEQNSLARNSLIESLALGANPLMFMKDPLLRNLLTIEFRRTTKSTSIRASQNLYYFPAVATPGLTEQDSDLGMIFYEQKAAGTQLAYTIKERDWLFTVGFYALRAGFFDLDYTKPYQMDADIYDASDRLIDQRVYLFEGQATGRGLMLGLQNLYFPTFESGRFFFSMPDQLGNGFFWGLKELGFYWGTGNIRLQNNIDLVEKYQAFYQSESGHEPSVTFLRQVFHPVIGYKFNRHFKLFIEYRYVNYSLSLEDSYEDGTYNYFLNHAVNRDTIQQFAVNLTVGF